MQQLSVAAAFAGSWFKTNAKLLVACFAVGLICHFQMYSNGIMVFDGMVSADNASGYGWFMANGWDLSLGRWGLLFATMAKAGLCSPTLVSAISLALFAVGIVALISLLGIEKPLLRYLTAFTLICTPFVSGSLVYYYCSNSYALCFTCAILAAAAQGRPGSAWAPWRIVSGALLLVFALGCYQASMGVFCITGLLVLVAASLERAPRTVLTHFGKLLVVLAVGVVLYFVVNSAVLAVAGFSMGEYGGASSISAASIFSSLPSSIVLAYSSFAALMFGQGVFGNSFYEPKIMALFVCLVIILLAVSVGKRGKRQAAGSVLTVLFVALLPLAANIVIIAASSYGAPTIPMVGGFVAGLALLPVLAQACCGVPSAVEGSVTAAQRAEITGVAQGESAAIGKSYVGAPFASALRKETSGAEQAEVSFPTGSVSLVGNAAKVALAATCILLALLAWSYALQCNADSEVMLLEQNQAQSLTVRAVAALEANESVQNGAQVLIVGNPQQGNYPSASSFYGKASDYARYGITHPYQYTNNYRCWRALEMKYAGVHLNLCEMNQVAELCRTSEFQAMPTFPNEGSIAEVNGVVVLKISNTNGWE
jgi:hypothetical protein